MGCFLLCSLPTPPPPARGAVACHRPVTRPLVFSPPSAGFPNAVYSSTLGLSLNNKRNRRPFPEVPRNSNPEGQDRSTEDEDSTDDAKQNEENLEMDRRVDNGHPGQESNIAGFFLEQNTAGLADYDEEDSFTALSARLVQLTEILQSQASTIPPVNDLINDYNETSLDATNQGSTETQEEMPHENLDPLPLAGSNAMNVIFVGAECAPWSKTGGLGDVVGELPKALARRGHRVMVVAPRYGTYLEAQDVGVLRRYKADGQDFEVTYHHAYIDHVDFVFIDAPVFRHIEHDIYSGSQREILKRMVILCKAAVEVPWHVPCGGVCYGDGNLVFVANDWHAALLPVYLKECYRNRGLMAYARSVLVIHNVSHQGRGPLDDYGCIGLPDHCMELFDFYDPVGGQHLNILVAGLKCADRVVTVSRGYAWELRTPEGGWGLHKLMNEISWKLDGIINGINPQIWNPKFDAFLTSDGFTNYDLETLRTGKAQCKAALQRELGLEARHNTPIVAFIGRLDDQKGVELIAEAMHWFAGQDLQLVMLGAGRADLEDKLRKFERENHDKVRGCVGFSEKMAHRITAGADVLLMPSRFEPCGLNQLYAMMYGTVPVAHAVGGLRDSVQQFDPLKETGVGWLFDTAESKKMIDALAHCLNTYRNYRKSWEGLQARGMAMDFSWDKAAEEYERVLVKAKNQW